MWPDCISKAALFLLITAVVVAPGCFDFDYGDSDAESDGTSVSVDADVDDDDDDSIIVPDVVGLTQSDAEWELRWAGFFVGSVTYQDTSYEYYDGRVASQYPTGGTEVSYAGWVSLVVYRYVEDDDGTE